MQRQRGKTLAAQMRRGKNFAPLSHAHALSNIRRIGS
jgi:hypothetical protein